MRNVLEYWAAAAGLAEEGDQDTALELIEELNRLQRSAREKILVVSNDKAITRDVAMHLVNLAKRLSSEILFVSSSSHSRDASALPESVQRLRELAGAECMVAYLPAKGWLQDAVKLTVNTIHNVEFAVLIGRENQRLRRLLRIPIFSA